VAKGGSHGWDALTYLCFSKYLRLDPARSDGFVRAATALLDARANSNTGFYEANHQPKPEWESVLYGAAGVAHHPELTRLLLERGADPNVRASLRKDGRDYRDVTPLAWGERFHEQDWVNQAAMRVIAERGGRL